MFFAYEKIEEDFKQYAFSEADYRRFKKTDWVVTEKIHGANFSVHLSAGEIRYANRKAILNNEDDFFHYQTLAEALHPKFRQLFNLIQAQYPDIQTLIVYGELFGGAYPHPQVPKNPAVLPVQTGVYYSPKIEFWVFDLGIILNSQADFRDYLDFTAMRKFCQLADLPAVEPLLIGKYEAAVNFAISFQSTIPAKLGLPALPDNWAEGVVIRPAQTFYLETPKGKFRPILKRKIKAFSEQKYHEAQKWNYQELQFVEKLGFIESQVDNLATQNRLQNAISKIGRVKKNDVNKIEQLKKLLWTDILEEFKNLYLADYQIFGKKEIQHLEKTIVEAVAQLLKNEL
jgi:Rnl2 family RNA ligase